MKKINIILIALLGIFAASCDSYLDETPDNRAEVDSQTKIRKLLVSAYTEGNHAFVTELASDNIDDTGSTNPYSDRFSEQLANWVDLTESDNEDTQNIWEGAYTAIAHSNEALAAIEELGDENLLPEKGEALITRAYSHFILVNVFCKHYNAQTSATDLGITYMTKSETTLDPKYERGNVKDVYEKINADIEAALPLISDDIYEVGSYHFTKKAAYAFAARFNLYYEKWQKAKDYASVVLTENPSSQLRDWSRLGALPRDPDVVTKAYINDPANLLALTSNSNMGVNFGAFYTGSRFNHSRKIADEQTLLAPAPWGTIGTADYRFRLFIYSGNNLDKSLFYKIPYLFEITDPVAQIGYSRTVMIPFTTDETLLVRAEAETMLDESDLALADLNLWSKNFFKDKEATLDQVNTLYNDMPYSSEALVTQKKKLSPKFTITPGIQENLIHYVLQCRRILTMHEGLRWFDIKRYGIEVPRFQIQADETVVVLDILKTDDLRKAIQLPQDVRSAGLEANPR
ncbi:RagB/SusD family nutrient uptake outer membrane protein [Ancylomarina salipaludis]|uniref:RagB/SusD family nutrient uptake outer membrane protein n=1 Tax=Ancylomarina salipaludis TaxID=2501299 RepID=A0A4Q1JLB7_9BACT|nr:RagB/SusD family nutrient uptake outer membrane protein [Ancylomarina salipaludis]RXQ92932.1 RagB/SusD family nutrient uptake outer membrane protein [Ancylomarina salipaludis]